MGLAGRKQKQRIQADPRNLSWADDASRFGLSYLSKFGWNSSKGLGSSGEGMRTHLKVQQKLDMMGIGAQHQRDPNGIAWKQNKDFEALLKRLNECAERGKKAEDEDTEREENLVVRDAFVRIQEEKVEENSEGSAMARRRRKYEDCDDQDTSDNLRKKQKKEKKKHRKSSSNESAATAIDPPSEPPSTLCESKPCSEQIPRSRPMAHRARIRAAKRISGKSASAIAEILGISPSSSVSTSTSTLASTPASRSSPPPQSSLPLDILTISTKSVADYFKEKLLVRPSSLSSPTSSSAFSGSATPGLGTRLGHRLSSPDDNELPRKGIGSRVAVVPVSSPVPEALSTSAGCDGNVDEMTEKQHRKAERKAEKRRWREAGPWV